MKILFFLLIFSYTAFSQKLQKNIIDFGARPDGITNNTIVIQNAIDEVYKLGGGKVIVPRGRFVTGVLHLKSNVELNINEEAVLLASTNITDYGISLKVSALIVADNEKNISITGKGLIDGQSDLLINDIYVRLRKGEWYDDEWRFFNEWHQRRPSELNRPLMIHFKNCDGVAIKNIHLQNGTCWIQNYEKCKNIIIDSINVFSNTFCNNDGIDLVDCKNAKITNCNINCADDGICLKSSDRNSSCENIFIAHCKVRSSANAIKLGTASHGGFKNIVIKNIEVYDTYRSAIAIETVDGGVIDGVDVKNINAVNTGNAIFIKLGHRNKDAVYSSLRNVSIANVKVEVPLIKPDKGYPMEGPELKYPPTYKKTDTANKYQSVSPWNNSGIDSAAIPYPYNVFPSSISGLPGHWVENVTLQNIEINYATVADKKVNYFPIDSFQVITEAEKDYPEFSMFGELPVWGFYVRHVNGLTMKNITVNMKGKDFRKAFLFNDVKQLMLHHIAVEGKAEKPEMFFYDVIFANKK